MNAENQITDANNQISATEGVPKRTRRDQGRPRFPIDRRTLVGRRVAAFERDLVAVALAKNGKSKSQWRPLSAEQKKDIRLACAYEALCARLEYAVLVGDSLDVRGLTEATEKRDRLVRRLSPPLW